MARSRPAAASTDPLPGAQVRDKSRPCARLCEAKLAWEARRRGLCRRASGHDTELLHPSASRPASPQGATTSLGRPPCCSRGHPTPRSPSSPAPAVIYSRSSGSRSREFAPSPRQPLVDRVGRGGIETSSRSGSLGGTPAMCAIRRPARRRRGSSTTGMAGSGDSPPASPPPPPGDRAR